MSIPEISIIIPAYNIEDYLKRCLESVLKQTFSDYEVIIIDDGSTDKTGIFSDEYVNLHTNISVKHCKNSGVSRARNLGMEIARGKYMVFMDGDDYVSENYLELLWKCVADGKAQMGAVDYFLSYPENLKIHSLDDGEKKYYSSEEAISLLRDKTKFEGYLWNKIFSRELAKENDIFFDDDIRVWEDMIFCYRYMKIIETVAYVQRPLYYYEQRSSSVMHSRDSMACFPHYPALKILYGMVELDDKSFYYNIIDEYGACLVGMLGSVINSKEDIRKALSEVKKCKAKLSLKHKMKYMMYRIGIRIR